jgi:serine/threonine-protein kinase
MYSLGVMMFEMLSGKLPFQGEDGMTMALARQLGDAPSLSLLRPDLPQEAVSLVARCLSRRPEDRIATAEELRSALLSLPISVDQQSSRSKRPSVLNADSAGILSGESRLRTVAVWPILNQGTHEQNEIAQGISDSLVDALSSLRGIRVIGRAEVARQRKQTPDPLDSARALGAQVLLCGSLSVQGQSLQAALRLHAAESGFQLWSRRWELPFAQALGLCRQAAQAVASAMITEMMAPQNDCPLDPETLALYLRARHLFTGTDNQFFQRSVELLEQALARQPDSPLLLVGHAKACARLWFWGQMEDKQKAMAAAERAVQAAPNQAASYSALGAVLYGSGQLAEAVRALRRALSIDPQLADAHDLLGRILCECGPLADAVEYLETALRIDPLSARARLDMIRLFALSGTWKQVDVLLAQEVIDPRLVPMWWMMTGRLALWRKDPAVAKRFLAMPGDESLGCQRGRRLLRMAAQEDGSAILSSEEMRRFFHTSERDNPRRRVIMYQAETEVHSHSGRSESALRTLQSSVDLGLTDIMWMDFCPILSVLRDDPSFHGLRTIVAHRAETLREALESPLTT